MKELIAPLLSDFYKQCHPEQYDPRITKLVSYYTPRMTRIPEWKNVPVLGIQSFVKEYLIDNFNKNFFDLQLVDVIEQYEYVIEQTLGKNRVNSEKIRKLHKLGYLPLEICALEEGTLCPIKCPMIQISNTHPDFAWVVNNIETLMSAELWYPMVTAQVGVTYRSIVNKWFERTCDYLYDGSIAISEFGYRGAHSNTSAIKASVGFLCSFRKTSTIPAIWYIHQMYGDNLRDIATGLASTEHSVMCSSFSLDGDEITAIKRLLTEVYPNGNFSMVSDSYDYWNVVKNVLPQLKEEIFNRNGTVFIRGDSGDPVEIVTKTVQQLWNDFGGIVNNKGYKVIDSHIRAIYGDAITPKRANEIYNILEQKGFSAENIALGAGSLSMIGIECMVSPDAHYRSAPSYIKYFAPYTRDTFGVATKSTYGEYIETFYHNAGTQAEEPQETKYCFNIFKDPKTDTDSFKKSQKGCCVVHNDPFLGIIWEDGYNFEYTKKDDKNILLPIFKDGKLLRETSFNEVRNRLWNNKF